MGFANEVTAWAAFLNQSCHSGTVSEYGVAFDNMIASGAVTTPPVEVILLFQAWQASAPSSELFRHQFCCRFGIQPSSSEALLLVAGEGVGKLPHVSFLPAGCHVVPFHVNGCGDVFHPAQLHLPAWNDRDFIAVTECRQSGE